MTLDEVLRRIVVGHWRLLVLALIVPLGLTAAWQWDQEPSWAASVRMQTLPEAAGSPNQSAALSSRVLALATTPSLVRSALAKAGVTGDAEAVAADQVGAERLGESSVVVLTVTSSDRRQASLLVTALAAEVAAFVNEASPESFRAVMADTETALSAATQRVGQVTARLIDENSLARQTALAVQLEAAEGEVSRLRGLRDSLRLQLLGRDQVVNINAGDPVVTRVTVALAPRLALAGILGMLLGLFGAVAWETARPRIPGIRNLARRLDAPILGLSRQSGVALANAMSRAARRSGYETLVIMGVDARDEKVARSILSAAGGHVAEARAKDPTGWMGMPSPRRAAQGTVRMESELLPPLPVFARFTDLGGVAPHEELSAGVVVVSSGRNREADVMALCDVLTAMRWSSVGVIHAPRRVIRGR